jgi:hypothetical protein
MAATAMAGRWDIYRMNQDYSEGVTARATECKMKCTDTASKILLRAFHWIRHAHLDTKFDVLDKR